MSEVYDIGSKTDSNAMSRREFIALAALMISLVALSIDAMLPALSQIGEELGVESANDAQLIVSALFLGLAIAQMFFGPLSDSWGRKPAIYLGLVIFMIGSVVALVATDFETMLVGRVLQGVGAAGPKVVTVAAIRDQFKGASMARIMSSVLAVFIVVPAFAPAIGQAILSFAHWRGIYVLLLIQGMIAFVWFWLRQPETLAEEHRLPFSIKRVFAAVLETVRNKSALGYTIAAGFIFGAFLGYLNSAQQIFQDMYRVGQWFPACFGGLALTIGLASLVNGRLVERLGMFRLSLQAVIVLAASSLVFAGLATAFHGHPPLWTLLSFLVVAFFCIGILFGNFNALAMEPLGHIAGTASAVIASLSTYISLVFGIGIGRAFGGTVLPLAYGMAVLASLTVPIMFWVQRNNNSTPQE
ncbi:MAG: multidrug effflux MFS transporter [Kofleriaceae bacterium]|nr:multidrug effflux MFS transporter [Kofleriaceae bacterium]